MLRNRANQTLSSLSQLPNRQPLRCPVGVAVPALEAWLRCGQDRRISEAAWRRSLVSNSFSFTTKSLKHDVYGTERPSLLHETNVMIAGAIALANQLDMLEQKFPGGLLR
jgi:hypothetical protein